MSTGNWPPNTLGCSASPHGADDECPSDCGLSVYNTGCLTIPTVDYDGGRV